MRSLARMRELVALLVLATLSALAHAQVGHVVSVQGSALVQRDGAAPRILGTGERLEQKDVITTAQGSHAVLEFSDKTRVTLRPNTTFRVESYTASAPGGMVFGLTKGGFRAVTGDIAKKNPSAVRFRTDTVVLGVRGTEFDARLCEADCASEGGAQPVLRASAQPAARVIELSGTVNAVREAGESRTLVAGAFVFPGERVTTAAESYALLAFRDGSRITLNQTAELAIAQFDFDERATSGGHARVKLVTGNAHVWTGALAKRGPDHFLFETSAGVIRPLGTGFSVGGTDVVVIHTWDGSIILQTGTERVELPRTGTLAVTIVDGKIAFLPTPPADLTESGVPRPDLVNVDPSTLGHPAPPTEPGLYVWVRDGAVTLGLGEKLVELKAGHAARIGAEITLLDAVPAFMRFDLTPRPGTLSFINVPRFFKAPDGSVTRMCR